jgi:hypothetical protein
MGDEAILKRTTSFLTMPAWMLEATAEATLERTSSDATPLAGRKRETPTLAWTRARATVVSTPDHSLLSRSGLGRSAKETRGCSREVTHPVSTFQRRHASHVRARIDGTSSAVLTGSVGTALFSHHGDAGQF